VIRRKDTPGSKPFIANVTVKVVISALSAAGSSMDPKTECILNRLAKYPSSLLSLVNRSCKLDPDSQYQKDQRKQVSWSQDESRCAISTTPIRDTPVYAIASESSE